ncbi:hypothetical protein [Escherichia phage IME08]|uniref:Uncharacterized protein nrdA.1 n=1 Tax=Escherichia phage IME08 TaxID=698728 RepID=D7RMN3_9CAUD|nr:hypothetical protein IME08_gp219 [Escherichia phage IME08]ADI55549.1 hypothetical protein [Escherichia phage IME08]
MLKISFLKVTNHTLLLRLKWLYENSNNLYSVFGYYGRTEFHSINISPCLTGSMIE